MSEHHTEEFTYSIEDQLTTKQQAISIMLQKYQDLRGESREVRSPEEAERIIFAREFAEYLLDHLEELKG